jgi:hypothetical protein
MDVSSTHMHFSLYINIYKYIYKHILHRYNINTNKYIYMYMYCLYIYVYVLFVSTDIEHGFMVHHILDPGCDGPGLQIGQPGHISAMKTVGWVFEVSNT